MARGNIADPGLDLVQGIDLLGAVVLLAITIEGVDDREEVLGEAVG